MLLYGSFFKLYKFKKVMRVEDISFVIFLLIFPRIFVPFFFLFFLRKDKEKRGKLNLCLMTRLRVVLELNGIYIFL